MKNITISVLTATLLLLSGCAQKAENIQGVYVSPIKYQNYGCDQLGQELGRINDRVNVIAGKQDKKATQDTITMGVGLVLFWPALFFLATDDQKDELSRLKGEYEAVRSVGVEKNCAWAKKTPIKS